MARRDDLKELFQQLPTLDRACMILHYRGYSNPKIANMLGLEVECVSATVLRGSVQLQTWLNNDRRFNILLDINA